jgi:glycosyltransferase involved in cell wall biosynthesis
MRILHVTPYYEHAWAYGGIPRVAAAQARGLVARGHRVTVCTTDAAARGRRTPTGPTISHGVEVERFRNRSDAAAYHLQWFMPAGLSGWLARHAGEFDVAHVHGCHHLPGAQAARALVGAGVPYLLQPHGTAPRIERRAALKWAFDHTLGRRVVRDAAIVVGVSAAEARQLVALGVAPSRIRIVPNPVDLVELGVAVAEDPAAVVSERIVYLGKLTPRKQLDVLIAAFAGLDRPAATLVIAGNDMGVVAGLRRQVRALGLDDRVRFVGLLEGAARQAALRGAAVVAYPGRDEIFGLVAAEALALGVPVVVADDSGCGELVAELGGGAVVRAGEVAALASALDAILAAPATWRAAAATAAVRVRERLAPTAVCEQLEALYREASRWPPRRMA